MVVVYTRNFELPIGKDRALGAVFSFLPYETIFQLPVASFSSAFLYFIVSV